MGVRVYAGPGSEFRRRHRPTVKRDIVVDGGVVRAGEHVPDSVSLHDVDRLGVHGYVDRRPGDDGVDSG